MLLVGSITCILGLSPKQVRIFRFSDLMGDETLMGLDFDTKEDLVKIEKKFEQASVVNECQIENNSNPFCIPKSNLLKLKKNIGNVLKEKVKLLSIQRAVRTLQKSDFQNFNGLSEADLAIAIQRMARLRPLASMIRKVLRARTCPSTVLLTALGLQMESQFPGMKFKNLALSLYRRSVQCGSDAASVQAAYRLGLMEIESGKCDLAEKILSQISADSPSIDYRMRVAYWRFYCAEQQKNIVLRDQLKKWIVKEYPLSLHSLLVRSDSEIQDFMVGKDEDIKINFRSFLDPQLNEVTRAIEILLRRGDSNEAVQLIEPHLERVLKTEVGFQLYWAILFKRCHYMGESFEWMAKVFRLNPQLISKRTLQFMYPQNGFSLIQMLSSSVDPYLTLSVIRQESAFDQNAKSPSGAIGLMQIQFATARNFEKISKKQLYDPKVNIRIGLKYFSRLLHSTGKIEMALAAYNAGPGRLKQWKRRYSTENRLLFIDLLPLRETRDYVSSIARNYYWYLKLYDSMSPALQHLPFFDGTN